MSVGEVGGAGTMAGAGGTKIPATAITRSSNPFNRSIYVYPLSFWHHGLRFIRVSPSLYQASTHNFLTPHYSTTAFAYDDRRYYRTDKTNVALESVI